YTVNLGVAVLNANYGASQNTIVLTTSSLFPGTNYTVTIRNIRDQSVPALFLFPNPTLATFAHGQGYDGARITHQRYDSIGGNGQLNVLLNASRFPGDPTLIK